MICPTQAPLHVIHAHSVWSVLDAAATVDEYINHVKENDLGFLSLTEHGYCIGWHDLVTKCHKHNIKPCCGCEVYLMPRSDIDFDGQKPFKYYHLTLLAKNEIGHKNIRDLSSRAWGPDRITKAFGQPKPRTTFEDLSLYSEGVICGSGCIEGPISKHILRNEPREALKNAEILKDIYGDNLFMEVMPSSVDHDFCAELIEVEDEEGNKYSLLPDDTVETDQGRMTVSDAMGKNILDIRNPIPMRVGNHRMTE